MLGVELVTDRQQKTPANAEILHVMDQMKGTNIYILYTLKLINLYIYSVKYHYLIDHLPPFM